MNQRGLDQLARAISLLGSAPIVAAVTFILLVQLTSASFLHLSIALVFATLLPLAVLFFLSKTKFIQDVNVSDKNERVVPFVGVLGSYLIGLLTLIGTGAAPIVTGLMVCYFANTLIMMMISFKWKISVHASGVTGPITALIYHFGLPLSPILLLVIPVGWARLHLKAHDELQVAAGALLTILLTWLELTAYLALI